MSYSTINDLIARYGEAELIQLTDTTQSGTYDAAVVQQALDDADSIVNSYLAARVTVPLSAPIPGVVVIQSAKIARWFLWKDRRSDAVMQDYNDAIAWLKMVAQGLIPIGADAPETASSNLPRQVSNEHVFTRDKMKDF